MLQRLLSALVFLLVSSSAQAEDCEELLNSSSLWVLPPKAQRLVIGMLAETVDHKELLAVADYYWGSHEVVHLHLDQKYRLKRILWAGEMLLENPKDENSIGMVVLTINTSGFVFVRLQQANTIDTNDSNLLKEHLERYLPKMRSEFTQYFIFSNEHAHLDPLFQELQVRLQASTTDTVRHRFRNILSILVSLSKYLTKVQSENREAEIHQINQLSASTMNDIIKFFESESRYSGRGIVARTRNLLSLARLRRGPEKKSEPTEQDFVLLIDLIKAQSARAGLAREEPEVIFLTD